MIAMGISTCLVVFLLTSLGSLIELATVVPKPGADQPEPMTVFIKQRESSTTADPAVAKQPDRAVLPETSTPNDDSEPQSEIASIARAGPSIGPHEVRNWHTIAAVSVKASSDERALREDSRALMWRQNYSIMFKPGEEFVASDGEPAIPDFRFKPQIHVAGLGFTIGGCFIGIPLVGVAVEQRTVGVRLFVCAADAG
jgi:hypothetical protein